LLPLLLLLLLQVLYDVNFALALFFSANWLLWFWLAEDRLRYVFSLMSLISAVTIIPAFVLWRMKVCY
jgi:glucan phosphoethanolaminetransferase (alkaline phosphatase superfamily)